MGAPKFEEDKVNGKGLYSPQYEDHQTMLRPKKPMSFKSSIMGIENPTKEAESLKSLSRVQMTSLPRFEIDQGSNVVTLPENTS